jgi:hypothetical protein
MRGCCRRCQWVDRSRYLKEDGSRLDDGEMSTCSTRCSTRCRPRASTRRSRAALRAAGPGPTAAATPGNPLCRRPGLAVSTRRLRPRHAVRQDDGPHRRHDARHGTGRALRPGHPGQRALQFDLAAAEDGTKPGKLVGPMSIDPHTYWDMITGKVGAPQDESLAHVRDGPQHPDGGQARRGRDLERHRPGHARAHRRLQPAAVLAAREGHRRPGQQGHARIHGGARHDRGERSRRR